MASSLNRTIMPQLPTVSPPDQTSPHTSDDRHIKLSSSQIRIAWCLINVFHLFNASFALIAGAAHLVLATPQVYENMFLVRIPRPILVLAGWSYMAVASLHVLVVVHCLRISLRRRRLTFGHDDTKPDPHPTTGIILPSLPRRFTRLESLMNVSKTMATTPVVIWKRYFGLDGLLGVFGPQFELGFHTRQLLEIVLQTYQAYQLSCGVPRNWINRFIVAILVVNCFSTPTVEFFLKTRRPSVVRLTSVAIDLVIDFAITVIVPMCVIVPRLLEFDWKIGAYPAKMIYDDLWLTTAVSEARQVFVTTELDYISSLLPPFLWLVALDTIKNMVRRQSPKPVHEVVLVRGRTASLFTKGRIQLQRIAAVKSSRSKHVNRISMAWGVGVIVLHFLAQHPIGHTNPSSISLDRLCKLRLNAWLARQYPCSVVLVDCHENRIKGESGTLENYLTEFDRATLTKVIFSHCSALEVPSMVTEFAQLRSFVTFNTTISSWPRAAALTRTRTPLVVALDMIDTNMSTLPEGIYHDGLPQGLNFLLYRSNLSSLPHDIGDVWGSHNWISMWLEHTNLKELPVSFSNLQIQKLALMGNQQLSNFLEDVFEKQAFGWLRLSRNLLLSQLPASLGDTSRLSHLLCEDTNVTTLSAQVLAWLGVHADKDAKAEVVSFHGSPVCELGLISTTAICGELPNAVKDEFRYDLIVAQRRIQ